MGEKFPNCIEAGEGGVRSCFISGPFFAKNVPLNIFVNSNVLLNQYNPSSLAKHVVYFRFGKKITNCNWGGGGGQVRVQMISKGMNTHKSNFYLNPRVITF